eukprot:GHVT01025816.1.p2 GENE.GHVT01025816.1~~GHVT01025816.1.p2  ORF type:complete len:152 (+),score=13.16 GHVT01025816.1:1688-2143(+)
MPHGTLARYSPRQAGCGAASLRTLMAVASPHPKPDLTEWNLRIKRAENGMGCRWANCDFPSLECGCVLQEARQQTNIYAGACLIKRGINGWASGQVGYNQFAVVRSYLNSKKKALILWLFTPATGRTNSNLGWQIKAKIASDDSSSYWHDP